MRPDGPRPQFAGPPSAPEKPYPIRLSGPVIRGFGRGSKDVRFLPPPDLPKSCCGGNPIVDIADDSGGRAVVRYPDGEYPA